MRTFTIHSHLKENKNFKHSKKQMLELINVRDTDNISITLKNLTDYLSVRQNDAMSKVEKLSKEHSFGELLETRIRYNKGRELRTYILSKKQATAVGAKLNNELLMKLVDKLEELSTSNKHLTIFEQISLIAQGHQEVDKRITVLEKTKRLENWQEKSLQDAKNKKVYEIAQDDKELASKLHRKVWSLFKKAFHLPRYNELPAIKYEDGLSYINNLTLADMVA